MNYEMGESGYGAIGASEPFFPNWIDVGLGWFAVGVVALVFGYVIVGAAAQVFKLGPYSPAGIARAEARRLKDRADPRSVAASAEARRFAASIEASAEAVRSRLKLD